MNTKTISFLLLLVLGFTLSINAEGDKKDWKKLTKVQVEASPIRTFLNINNVFTVIKNDGITDIDRDEQNSGLIFPKGSGKTACFQTGLLWGGRAPGDPQVRVGGTFYSTGLQGGKITDSGLPYDQLHSTTNEDPLYRIYRVRRDVYPGGPTVDLSSEINSNEGSAAQIRAQYELDWDQWPATGGAPFEDKNGNGTYEPATDIPGFPGSDQTIWCVANDLNSGNTRDLYGTQPMGMELQMTYWAYNRAGALGNMFFRKYILINKSNVTYDSVYVTLISDVDLGNATDDYVGCDTTLSLGFCYNANAVDATYNPLPPPSIGFDFFQGPLIKGIAGQDKNKNGIDDALDYGLRSGKRIGPGWINIPMTSFFYFARGDANVTDPTRSAVAGATEMYNFFQGRIGKTGQFFVDPNTGRPTTYVMPGDPLTGQGWLDGQILSAGDRRQGQASGPFTMAPGDTQEVVVAELLAGAIPGVDRISAVGLLKFYDKTAQDAFDNNFDLPTAPPTPEVNIPGSYDPVAKVNYALDKKIILDWGENTNAVKATEDFEAKGYKFEGYNVYQLPNISASISEGVRIATYDAIDNILKIEGQFFDISTGAVAVKVQQFGNDTGLKRYIEITTDALKSGIPLINGIKYYFAVTSYAFNPNATITNLENPLTIYTIIPTSVAPGEIVQDYGNTSAANIKHTGTADARVNVLVVDPTKLTGHEYQVFFDQQSYYLDSDGIWKTTNFPDSIGKKLGKDVSPSTLDLRAIYATRPGTIDLNFTLNLVSPTEAYADGITLTLPQGMVINSAATITAGGGDVTPIVEGNVIKYGLVQGDTTQNGLFHGGEVLRINVNSFTLPLSVNYIIHDDGYGSGGNPINATGTATVTKIGNHFVTQNQWNVKDITTDKVVLEDQTIFSGLDIYAGELGPGGSTKSSVKNVGVEANIILDGLQFQVIGSFLAPTVYDHLTLNGRPLPLGDGTGDPWDLTDYRAFGNATGTANEAVGYGTLTINDLQQDYEFRWTGELGDTVINGQTIQITKSGGSYATMYGARQYSIANHPLNPNPGTDARFLVRVPFEVWNLDKNIQVNYQIYDRGQANPAANGFKVWNTDARMYCEIINTPYKMEVVPDQSPNATWTNVWYKSRFTKGDVIGMYFANPIQPGLDFYAFTSLAPNYSVTKAKTDINKINVFPNPYYGVNSEELNKYNRFVTFTHLPDKATIRLFNLAGILVKIINKDNNSTYQRWDLANDNGLPVASGLYIAYIDMPELGKTKILKVAIIQEQQILDRF
ncbi:MAG: T9SS type A sorting domain-containing protein [Ignavibacteriales bacterium]|nr:T9SS type A sorting domain-containing protein [Ignavibacteriales bacterium]